MRKLSFRRFVTPEPPLQERNCSSRAFPPILRRVRPCMRYVKARTYRWDFWSQKWVVL
jgi:hypothetical protein